MSKNNSLSNIRVMALTGVLAAAVFAVSKLYIPIPTAIDNTRLHLGNVMCLLAGLLLGPVPGGLAAGIGSLFFDLTDPIFVSSAPFTLVFKFLMGFTCGQIAHGGREQPRVPRLALAAACGSLLYVVLYLSKTFCEGYFFNRLAYQTVLLTVAQKGLVSGVNAVISVAAVVPLYLSLRAGLRRAGFQLPTAGRYR